MILFKKINDLSSDFKEINSEESYDINETIFKIVSKDVIKSIDFDDGFVKNQEEKNYMYFHRLNVNERNILNLKVNMLKTNGTIYNSKFKIKIKENIRIFKEEEIEDLISVGEIGKILLTADFTENFSTLYNNEIEKYKNNEDTLKKELEILKRLVSIANKIINDPKVELIQNQEVKESNEVKRISSNSARYFSMHPEDWYKEGTLMPKPLKLLTDIYEENLDIYENQVVKHVLFKAIKKCDIRINSLTLQNRISNQRIKRLKSRLDSESIREDEVISIKSEIIKLNNILNKSYSSLKKFKEIIIDLKYSFSLYSEINLRKKMNVSVNQRILYDKRYLIIVDIYKAYLNDKRFEVNKNKEINGFLYGEYISFAVAVICESIMDLKFNIKKVNGYNKEFIFSNKNIKIFGDNNFGTEVIITLNLLNNFNHEAPIEVELLNDNKINKSRFYLDFSMKKFIDEEESKYIDKLYDSHAVQKHNDSEYIFNFLSIEDLKFSNKELEKYIIKLSNAGDNFISTKDYSKYGNLKVGMFTLSNSDYILVQNKLKNLFRNKLISLGMNKFCTFCGNNTLTNFNEMHICSSCGNRYAIHICECGEKIIKILSKTELEPNNTDISSNNLIDYHVAYELESNSLGSCYSNFHLNKGGFCVKCGKCIKKGRENCIRCNLLENQKER